MKTRFTLVLMATALAGSLAQAATNVFVAGFETTDTPTYANGKQIHNVPTSGSTVKPWNWSGGDIAVVTNAPAAVRSGSQGLYGVRSTDINSHLLWSRGTNAFAVFSNGIVELKADIKTTGWSNSQDSFLEIAASDINADNFGANSTRSGWVILKGNGDLQGWNGSGSAPTLMTGITLTNWHTIRMDVNLDSNSFNVFFDGAQVATNFAFYGGTGVDFVRSFQFKEYNTGLSTGGFYMDNVLVTAIPEPGTGALLGGAAALAAAFFGLRGRRPRP